MLCFFGSLSRRIHFDDLFFLASWGLKSSALSNVNDQFRIVHLVLNFKIKCILHFSCGLWWPFENSKTKQNNPTTSSQHWIFLCFFFSCVLMIFFSKSQTNEQKWYRDFTKHRFERIFKIKFFTLDWNFSSKKLF